MRCSYWISQLATTMSSLRAILCDLCIILLFGIALAASTDGTNSSQALNDDVPKGNCTCGGFPTDTTEPGHAPLLSQSPGLVVKCDEEGETTCKNLCNALATATKAKGPEVLCIRLKDASELKLSAFYKICDHSWTYAELTAEEPLCCEATKVKVCPSMQKTNSTDVVDAKTPL